MSPWWRLLLSGLGIFRSERLQRELSLCPAPCKPAHKPFEISTADRVDCSFSLPQSYWTYPGHLLAAEETRDRPLIFVGEVPAARWGESHRSGSDQLFGELRGSNDSRQESCTYTTGSMARARDLRRLTRNVPRARGRSRPASKPTGRRGGRRLRRPRGLGPWRSNHRLLGQHTLEFHSTHLGSSRCECSDLIVRWCGEHRSRDAVTHHGCVRPRDLDRHVHDPNVDRSRPRPRDPVHDDDPEHGFGVTEPGIGSSRQPARTRRDRGGRRVLCRTLVRSQSRRIPRPPCRLDPRSGPLRRAPNLARRSSGYDGARSDEPSTADFSSRRSKGSRSRSTTPICSHRQR